MKQHRNSEATVMLLKRHQFQAFLTHAFARRNTTGAGLVEGVNVHSLIRVGRVPISVLFKKKENVEFFIFKNKTKSSEKL